VARSDMMAACELDILAWATERGKFRLLRQLLSLPQFWF